MCLCSHADLLGFVVVVTVVGVVCVFAVFCLCVCVCVGVCVCALRWCSSWTNKNEFNSRSILMYPAKADDLRHRRIESIGFTSYPDLF